MPALWLFVLIIVVVGLLFFNSQLQAAWTRRLEAVAAKHGLAFRAGGFLQGGSSIWGTAGRCHFTVRKVKKGKSYVTRIQLEGPLSQSMGFGRRSLGSSLVEAIGFSGPDVEVGDPEFDHAVVVRGDPLELAAALDDRTRRAIGLLTAQGARITPTGLQLDPSADWGGGPPLEEACEAVMELASAFATATQGNVPKRLLRNVLEDPEPGVQRNCLRVLFESFPQSAAAREAVELLRDGGSTTLRLLVANHLGSGGVEIVRGVAFSSAATEDDLRAAVGAIVSLAAIECSWAISNLQELVVDRARGPVLVDALRALADLDAAPAVRLLEGFAAHPDPAVRGQAARCLGSLDSESGAEAVLLSLLDPEHEAVATEAARSLERIGSVRAVEPLLELSKGVLRPAALKEAARGAIEAIQRRLGDVDGGRLALVQTEGHGGGLALAAEADTVPAEPAHATVGRGQLTD